MKIRGVEPILCDGVFRPWIFVKITTDEGLIGYGDCTDWDRGPSIAACIEDLGQMLVGRDPDKIGAIYWYLYWDCWRAIGGLAHKAIAGINNFLVLEFDRDDVPWRDDVLTEPLQVEKGHLLLPEGPGFGADLNEKEIAKHPYPGRWV